MKNNPGLSSLIFGIIANILNLLVVCLLFTTDTIYNSLYLIIISIVGIVNAIRGMKLGQGLLAIIGLIANIIAVLGSLLLLFIYIIA